MDMDKREIDLKLAPNFEKRINANKAILPIDNDTAYDIYFDICEYEENKYLYIKMIENTANAPFYYNKSYTIEDLHSLHKIFKADNIDEVKIDLKTLFDQKKIKLSFDKNKEIILMELDVINFATNYKINFELYKEMIPFEEKDQRLIDLYNIEKQKLKVLKEINLLIKNLKGNKGEKDFIFELKKKIDFYEIPGLNEINENKKKIEIENEKKNKNKNEKPEYNNENIQSINEKKEINNPYMSIERSQSISEEKDDEKEMYNSDITIERKKSVVKNQKICKNLLKEYIFRIKKGKFDIYLELNNFYDMDWPFEKVQLICDEKSDIKPKDIEYPMYDIEPGQDGDFTISFNKDDIKPGKFKCYLQLYVNGVKMDDSDIELNIKAK
jgi:hypothetical protein